MQSGNKVQLRATFPPTLSFYVSYSLKPTDASNYELISRIWQAAAESLCSNEHIATLLSDKTLQSQIAAVPAEESLPVNSSQTQKELTVEVLSKLSEAVRPLLICVQILRTAQSVLTGMPQKSSSLSVAIAELCETVSEPGLPLPHSALFRHVAVLRSALLVIKAATVSAEGFDNPIKPHPTKEALWNTVHIIGGQLYDSAIDAKGRLTKLPNAGSPLAADTDQAQHLSSLLINLIMPILKQHIKGGLHAGQQTRDYMPTSCYIIMDSLLTTTESPVLQALTQAAASHMLKSGQIQHHHSDTAYCRSKKYIMYVCQAAGVSQNFAIGCCNSKTISMPAVQTSFSSHNTIRACHSATLMQTDMQQTNFTCCATSPCLMQAA